MFFLKRNATVPAPPQSSEAEVAILKDRMVELENAMSILRSLDRSQARIEFEPEGTILTTNENFLKRLVTNWTRFATDITQQKRAIAEVQNRSTGVIEFEPDGTVIMANPLFLALTGYSLSEIEGRHHRMFMPQSEQQSSEYLSFWKRLGSGESIQGDFRRVGKQGNEIWLRGAYNAIIGSDGTVVRVVKNVSDITRQIEARHHASEVGTSIGRSVTEMSQAISEIST